MRIGEILSSLLTYKPRYDDQMEKKIDHITDLFKYDKELVEISIGPILVFTDRRPNSLLAISYAIRLTSALDTTLYAITEDFHNDLISEECKKHNIELTYLNAEVLNQSQIDIVALNQKITSLGITLAITHFHSHWKDILLEKLRIPILITKIDNFTK
ncbi:MAG: hypothetical protein INQ03_18925 [Candidatus Heimdallarchaeota archaeon]|nr:hypothetical protein [Candidatus Heimdallarchaeota archaeon]